MGITFSFIILIAVHLGLSADHKHPGVSVLLQALITSYLIITFTLNSPLCLGAPCFLSLPSYQNNLLKCWSDLVILLSIRASILNEIKTDLTAKPLGHFSSLG